MFNYSITLVSRTGGTIRIGASADNASLALAKADAIFAGTGATVSDVKPIRPPRDR